MFVYLTVLCFTWNPIKMLRVIEFISYLLVVIYNQRQASKHLTLRRKCKEKHNSYIYLFTINYLELGRNQNHYVHKLNALKTIVFFYSYNYKCYSISNV